MKTAATIDAVTRLVVFAAVILIYQYFLATYIEHTPDKAWAIQLWRHFQEWRRTQRERIPEPSAFKAIRLKRTVELPQEPNPA